MERILDQDEVNLALLKFLRAFSIMPGRLVHDSNVFPRHVPGMESMRAAWQEPGAHAEWQRIPAG